MSGQPVNEYSGFAAEQHLDQLAAQSNVPAEMLAGPQSADVIRGRRNMNARFHLAWLMWCFSEGYAKAEDRAIMENWMGKHQDNAEDEATRQALLTMADEILATWEAERG